MNSSDSEDSIIESQIGEVDSNPSEIDEQICYDEEESEALLNSVVLSSYTTQNDEACCHYLVESGVDLFCRNLMSMLEFLPSFFKMDTGCLYNYVSNVCSAILHSESSLLREEDDHKLNIKYNLIDFFLRTRHDLLHNLTMEALHLPYKQSDDKFSDVFDFMESSRTPDRILVKGEQCIIIETTATLNIFRSFIGKGKEEEGFKSKYENEILILNDNGYNTEYFVVIFDVKDPLNEGYVEELKKIALALDVEVAEEDIFKIENVRSAYLNFSEDITKRFTSELSNLMCKIEPLEITPNPNIDFLIKDGPSKLPNYNRIPVSTNVYNRMNGSWPRFMYQLQKSMGDYNGKIKPFFDHSTGRFGFMKNNEGLLFDEISKILITDDKPSFAKMLIQLFDGKTFMGDRADIEFFETVASSSQNKTMAMHEFTQLKHPNSRTWNKQCGFQDYSINIKVDYYKKRHHVNEDPLYENKLLIQLSKFYNNIESESDLESFFGELKKQPFAKFELTENKISEAVQNFNMRMVEDNKMDSNKAIIKYQKQPFLHCLADLHNTSFIDYRMTPIKALNVLSNAHLGPYTSFIFSKIRDSDFNWGSRGVVQNSKLIQALKDLKELHTKISIKQKEFMFQNDLRKFPKLTDIPNGKEWKAELSIINRKIQMAKIGHGGKTLSQVRAPCRGTSIFKKYFQEEMTHFKKKRESSFFKGVGLLDYERLKSNFDALKFELKAPLEQECPDSVYHDYVGEDSTLLTQLKQDYLNFNRDKYSHLKSTGLYHSSSFVSRMCHSLAFHSQTATSSDYVSVDNLGYDNVILFVRGGKKVFKTKKSKFFRLLYPIYNSIKDWYSCGDYQNSSTVIKYNDQLYVLTSWQVMDEVVMNDGLTFLHSTISYILLCHEPEINKALDKCLFNIMLAFHARRKTEELLHNIRYVCVNSIADISRLELMLPELSGFNYDFFQAFVRSSFGNNFEDFSKKLFRYNKEEKVGKSYFKQVGLKSPFDLTDIDSLEDLTMTIYSTFLMSKSPTNQALEQVKNLGNMLATKMLHDNQSSDKPETQYEMNSKSIESDIKTYWNELFESDFNFDSKYCNLLGKFSADYLNNIMDKGEAHSKWIRILNENWDNFANTKGLRGKDGSNFFNKKGYYIVYEEILKNEDYMGKIRELFSSDKDDFTKRKILNSLNKCYKDQFGCRNMKDAVFHVVDKKQRGGSREIFVMDLDTKINQQVIEKYLAYICKKIPNEAISVASNRRLQHIHTNVFEKFSRSDSEVYNLTLDCRKWAPHSVINKFIDMMLGMSGFFPESFITHFITFFSKMFNKKIYTRPYIRDIMIKNERYKESVNKNLKEDTKVKGIYFNMSYSWVMGIFNYMSSFMHVMNQIHASHIIMKTTMMNCHDITHYHMNAHSDDSAGKVQTKSKLDLKKTFFIYELLLKSCNHLLSDKKCNISKRYLEFLSVLYISKSLLSLIAKLSGAFRFHPTDCGYSGDITDCYSKTIEMISAGATFEQAYLSMKLMSHLVFKFYFNRDPSPMDYKIPPQLLGMPDSHPLIVLMSGGDSDVIRLTYKNEERFVEFSYLSGCFNNEMDLNSDLIPPIKAGPNIRISDELINHQNKIGVSELDEQLKWVLKNTQIKNTAIQTLKYGLMLQDKNFIAALIDETVTRRISRAYFFRTSDIVLTRWGRCTFKEAKRAINLFKLEIDGLDLKEDFKSLVLGIKKEFNEYRETCNNKYSLYELMNQDIYNFIDSTNNISYSPDDIIELRKTCKPIHVNIQKSILPTASDYSPPDLCIWIKKPEFRWLISVGDDYNNKTLQIKSFLSRHGVNLDDVDEIWLYNFLQKIKAKYLKEYFIYSNMPADFRDISGYGDLLNFLSQNSFKNKAITGITMPLGKNMSQTMKHIFSTDLPTDLILDFTVLNFVFSLCKNEELFNDLMGLKINSAILGYQSDDLYELLNEMQTKWETSAEFGKLIVPHMRCLMAHMKGELTSAPWLKDSFYYSFYKRQKLIGNVWLGKGSLYINIPGLALDITIINTKIENICVNKKKYTFRSLEISYINSVLINAGLPKLEDCFGRVDLANWQDYSLGINGAGLVCIDQNRNLKLSISGFSYAPHIRNPASSVNVGELTIEPNFSYNLIIKSEFEQNKVTLNTLKINPTDMLSVITSLYNTEKNNAIMQDKGEDFKKYMKMFIGEVSGVDFRVTKDQLFSLFQTTKIYHIFKTLINKDLLSQNSIKPRKHCYPGQDGGLLSILIHFKDLDDSFKFDYNTIMTPEMMMIKSSQPDAFVTNLVQNIDQKYKALYTGLDKSIIKRDLERLADIIDEDEYGKKLLSVLTNWGYIGVMGAVNEISLMKKAENYKSIRYYVGNDAMQKVNIEIFRNIIKSLLRATQKVNYFHNIDIQPKHPFYCKSLTDFKKTIISYVHTCMLSTYNPKPKQITYNTVMEQIKVSETLRLLMSYNEFCDELSTQFKKFPTLMLLPIEEKMLLNLVVALETLITSICMHDKSEEDLTYNTSIQRDLKSQLPYVRTKSLLEGTGFSFAARNVRHHGTMSPGFREKYKEHKLFKVDNRIVDIKFDWCELSEDEICFNKDYFIKRPLSIEDIDEEELEDGETFSCEFYDIQLEMQSEEIDIEMVKNFEKLRSIGEYNRTSLMFDRRLGRQISADYFDVKMIFIPNYKGDHQQLDRIRNTGSTILIVSNGYIPELMENSSENIQVFSDLNNNWYNEMLIDPDCLLYYLLDSKPIDIDMWCKRFNWLYLSKSSIAELKMQNATNLYMAEKGEVSMIDRYMSFEDKMSLLNDKMVKKSDLIEEEEVEKKLDPMIEGLKDQGYPDEFVEEMRTQVKSMKFESIDLYMESMVDNFIVGSKLAKDIASKTEKKSRQLIENLDDVNKAMKIFEVAAVFSTGKPTKSNVKNKSLKDKMLRAEVNALYPGLIDHILSGKFSISKNLHKVFLKHLRAMRRWILTDRKDRDKKMFMVDLCQVILNDAYTDDEDNEDEIFDSMIKFLTDKIINDEDDDENYTFTDTYSMESMQGRLYYDWL